MHEQQLQAEGARQAIPDGGNGRRAVRSVDTNNDG
jgi:hypothetical protein